MQFSVLVLTVKKYMKNPRMANESVMNELLIPLIYAAEMSNNKYDEYEISKQRASALVNNKEDVPKMLRDALNIDYIEEDTAENFETFIDDQLQSQSIDLLISELSKLIEKSNNLSKKSKENILNCKNNIPLFLTKSLLHSLSVNNRIVDEQKIFFKKGKNEALILKGDLFDYGKRKGRKIIVIPVETSFETTITWKYESSDKPLISSETLHGIWLNKMNQSGITSGELKMRILNYFSSAGAGDKAVKEHDIGSIAVIEHKDVIYYLLAISKLDINNRAISTKKDIEKSIISLLTFYDLYGQGLPLYLPLVGTGRSRAGLDYCDSLKLIVDAIKNNSNLIQGRINIVIKRDVDITVRI